jgi:hypothetical protein
MENAMRLISFAAACLRGISLLSVIRPAHAAPGDSLLVIGDNVNVRSGPSTATDVRMRVGRQHVVVEVERYDDWVLVAIAGSGGDEGWIHGSLLAGPDGQRLASPIAQAATPARSELSVRGPAEESSAAPQLPGVEGRSATAIADHERSRLGERAPAEAVRDVVPAISEKQPGDRVGAAAVEPATALVGMDPSRIDRFRDTVEYLDGRLLEFVGERMFTEVRASAGGAIEVGATDAWAALSPALQASYLNTLLDRWAAARGDDGAAAVRIIDARGRVLSEQRAP